MNHKKHSRSFSVFYRNSAILTINIEFVYSHKKIYYCPLKLFDSTKN